MEAPPPLDQPSARVVLLDERDRVLLQHLLLLGSSDPEIWVPPGGRLEAGESHEEAALRELWEETGIALDAAGPCVWTGEYVFTFRERRYRSLDRFFVGRVTTQKVRPHALTEDEREFVAGYRWWAVEEITTSSSVFVPGRLAELLPPLIAGDLPDAPIAVGP